MIKNIKEPITSAVGLTIVIITIVGLYRHQITWQWDGTIGICVGALFFLMPDKIVSLILSTLSKITQKFLGNESNS